MEKRAMRSNEVKAILKKSVFALPLLLLAGTVSLGQSVALTATRQTTTLPDGNTVPMWGWGCGAGTAPAPGTAMNGAAHTTGTVATVTTTPWQPPLTTAPSA